MALVLVVIAAATNAGVAAGAGERELHGLIEQLEALHVVDGALDTVCILKHDERLALGLQVRLGHDVDDGAVLGEQL